MTKVYVRYLLKRKNIYIITLFLVLYRILQLIQFSSWNVEYGVVDYLNHFTYLNNMALIFFPLYGVWIYQGVLFFVQDSVELRCKNRLWYLLQYGKIAALESLLYVGVMMLPVLVIVGINKGLLESLPYFLCVSSMLWAVWCVSSFLFFAGYQLLKKTYAAFLVLLAYGFFDYVLQGLFTGGQSFYISGALPFFYPEDLMFSYVIRLLLVLCILTAAVVCAGLCVLKTDFLRQEKGHE